MKICLHEKYVKQINLHWGKAVFFFSYFLVNVGVCMGPVARMFKIINKNISK